MEINSRKKLPLMAEVAMRVPLLSALNRLFSCLSSSWKQMIDNLFMDEKESEDNVHGQYASLHHTLCLFGVLLMSFLIILPARITTKLYVIFISLGILHASYWWSNQFLVKLHSNSSSEQWDIMIIQRQTESWRTLRPYDIMLSRDFVVYAVLQSAYSSLFALLLGHVSKFLPRLVTMCSVFMFLPVLVAIFCHNPEIEANHGLITLCQWVSIIIALLVITFWFWSTIYVSNTLKFDEYLRMIRTIYRDFGLQVLIEHEWTRLSIPTLLRVFWVTNAAWLILTYFYNLGNTSQDILSNFNWTSLLGAASEVAISGCSSFIMLLGMSAVIAKLANQVGCLVHMIIKSTDEEEKYIGTVSAVLFFILALQTGLTQLEGDARLVRLFRNLCLLFTAILHFIHNMLNQVMLSLGASQSTSLKRHIRVLFVAALLLIIPFLLFYHLWTSYQMSTWILAVSAFCLELCIKVLVTTSVYTLFMIDAFCETYWENLDDYIYYLKGTGSVIEFLFGIFLFFNGAWILLFESGGFIRALMMSIHAYFNIFIQAKEGWKTFRNRRTAVTKINSLANATACQLAEHDDVCAICYNELLSARVTPCGHLFHGMCLRKWLYMQDVCPMCQTKLVEILQSKVVANGDINEGVHEEPHVVHEIAHVEDHEIAPVEDHEIGYDEVTHEAQGTTLEHQEVPSISTLNSTLNATQSTNDGEIIDVTLHSGHVQFVNQSEHVMMSVRRRKITPRSRTRQNVMGNAAQDDFDAETSQHIHTLSQHEICFSSSESSSDESWQ